MMTTTPMPKRVARRTASPSAASPRAPACSPWPRNDAGRPDHRCGGVGDGPGRGVAQGDRRDVRPGALRRLHVDHRQVLLLASGASVSAPSAQAWRKRSLPYAPTSAAGWWPTPRAPQRTSPSKSSTRRTSTTRSRRRTSPGATCQVRDPRQGPELGPGARGRGHD